MTTVHTPPESEPPEVTDTTETQKPERTNRGLLVIVVLMVLAMVGLGIWAIVDSDDSVTLPTAAEETLDGYIAASLDYDGESFVNYVTDDYEFIALGRTEDVAAHEVTVSRGWAQTGFAVESVGPRAVSGQGATYVVAEPELAKIAGLFDTYGMSVYTLVEVDGTWLVQTHEWTEAR